MEIQKACKRIKEIKLSEKTVLCIMLFLLILALYIATLKIIPVSDTESNNYLPWIMIREHTITLDYLNPGNEDYMYYPHNDHYYATFPTGTSFAALPVYLIPSLFIDTPTDLSMGVLAKVSASLMMALAGALIFLIAYELSRNKKTAIFTTIVFAFATNIFSMASQMLLTFTGSILFLTLGIWFLVKSEKKPAYLYGAGFAFAYSGFCQPVCFLYLAFIGLFVLVRYKKQLIKYVIGAAPAVFLFLLYNFIAFGSILKTGETLISQFYFNNNSWVNITSVPISKLFNWPFFFGLANQLFSPSRGIFVFSPILIFSLAGVYLSWKKRGEYSFLLYGFAASVLSVLVVAKWWEQSGGNSFGYRITLSTIPFLVLLLVPVIPRILSRKSLAVIFSIVLAFSIFVQVVGYLSYDGGSWEARYIRTYQNGEYDFDFKYHYLWSLENNQLLWEIKNLHFYVSAPWQAGKEYPARDTEVTGIIVKETEPGYIAVGVETTTPRIARMGITVYDPEKQEVVTQLSPMLVSRGTFLRWTKPFPEPKNQHGLEVAVSVLSIGIEDSYIVVQKLDI